MTDIPKQATEPSDEIDKLSQIAQELPQDTEAPEAIPYVISFAKYNERMCEISELGGNKAKKAIEESSTNDVFPKGKLFEKFNEASIAQKLNKQINKKTLFSVFIISSLLKLHNPDSFKIHYQNVLWISILLITIII